MDNNIAKEETINNEAILKPHKEVCNCCGKQFFTISWIQDVCDECISELNELDVPKKEKEWYEYF